MEQSLRMKKCNKGLDNCWMELLTQIMKDIWSRLPTPFDANDFIWFFSERSVNVFWPIQRGNALKNWYLKKKKKENPTLTCHVSKTKTNLESKRKFSESTVNFFQYNVIFCTLHPHVYLAGSSNTSGSPGSKY